MDQKGYRAQDEEIRDGSGGRRTSFWQWTMDGLNVANEYRFSYEERTHLISNHITSYPPQRRASKDR